MTTPHLSEPILFTPPQLQSNPSITSQIISLANDAFARSKLPDPDKWDFTVPRFPTIETYLDRLSTDGVVALIFDQSVQAEGKSGTEEESFANGASNAENVPSGKVVGCCAAVPWEGGWTKEGAGSEEGFEIKAICVDGDEKYLQKGLAVKMMDALTGHLIGCAKSRAQTDASRVNEGEKMPTRAHLTLWILAAECINGPYWQRRGYREVRRATEGKGVWGCKSSFEMVVLRKDVEYELSV